MASRLDPRVAIAAPYAAAKRVVRSPRHPFQVETRPFALTPFFIAPVLPGETMTNLVLQNRVVTDPVAHPLIGFWLEHWFFYVKHRDLDGRDDFAGMMLDPAKDMSAYNSAASVPWFHAGGINWLKLCVQRITEEYFRDEGENWDVFKIGEYPQLQIVGNNVLDSLTNGGDYDADDKRVDLNIDGDAAFTADEIEPALAQWNALREAGLMPMDYEDYLRTYGVASRQDEESPNLHRPELLRHSREWSYPTNTIDPTNGTPRSAVSWSVALSADKARFFKEPGFVIGLVAVRPKVYLNGQVGSFVGGMNNVLRWLPAVKHDRPELSYMSFAEATGPLPGLTDDDGYLVDTRDLFVHGEQFSNIATPGYAVELPTATGGRRYVPAGDLNDFFIAPEKNLVKMDGVTTLSVRSRQKDGTPQTHL